MIPLRLKISGFLSYRQTTEVDFSGFDLACISGANGAGKSSLLDAITWSLFGKARKNNDDALINSNCDTAEVIFDFEYESNIYRILRSKTRGKTAVLEYSTLNQHGGWTPLSEHAMRETEKQIEQNLRMDYDTFINTSFFLQGKADQFAQQAAGRRKEILSSILGLEIWESYRETAALRRRSVESEISNIDAHLVEIENELAEENGRIVRLEELQINLTQKSNQRKDREVLVETCRRELSAIQEQERILQLVSAQLEDIKQQRVENENRLLDSQTELKKNEELVKKEKEIITAFYDLQTIRQDLEKYNALASKFNQLDKQRLELSGIISEERSRLEKEIELLQQRKKRVDEQGKQIKDNASQLNRFQNDLQGIMLLLKQKPDKEEQIQNLQEMQAKLAPENKYLRNAMDEIKAHIVQLKSAKGTVCSLCSQPLTTSHRDKLLSDFETQGKSLAEQYRKNEGLFKENAKSVGENRDLLQSLQKKDEERQRLEKQIANLQAEAEAAKTEIKAWQLTDQPRLDRIEKMIKDEDYASEAQRKLKETDDLLSVLGYEERVHNELRDKELAGRINEERFLALEKVRSAMQPLQREITNLEKQNKEIKGKIKIQQEAFEQAQGKVKAQRDQMPDLTQAEANLNLVHQEENELRMQVGAAQQRVDILKTQKQRKQDFLAQRNEHAKKVALLERLERAFGKNGVPALLIEQAMPDIESQANLILDQLSSGRMSLRFETQRERKSNKEEGAIQTLDIIISDAAGAREYELFSGGEAFRINFAIRLALAYALAKRAGARLQTLVIDEGFGSQDTEGRQRLVEAINMVMEKEPLNDANFTFSDIRKILVITHLDELKDAFPTRIEVEKTPAGSTVQVIS